MSNQLSTIFSNLSGLDERSVSFLVKALEKNNLEGFDYIEFKQSIANLASMNMDEATAIKSAFATANTMGVTKAKLLETAAHYQSVLLKEKSQFDTALGKQVAQRIDGKIKEVDTLKKQIEANQKKIKELQAQIEKDQGIISSADQHIEAEKQKIELTRSSFLKTHQAIIGSITKDIENINMHL